MAAIRHPIQVVSRLTGLSPHVIRVWERRYGAVTPERTGTNRRLYSDGQVERLRLLASAIDAGHKIGIIARLGEDELLRLLQTLAKNGSEDRVGEAKARVNEAIAAGSARREAGAEDKPGDPVDRTGSWVTDAVRTVREFNGDGLEAILVRGALRYGHNGVLHRVICPLAQEIGACWQRGEITAAHEHFASATIRDFLSRNGRPYAYGEGAPCAIIATPAGQLHELGAVMVAAVAGNLGWRGIFLGASLPPAEIAGAAVQNSARVVLLSIVYPADDRELPADLRQLREYLPAGTEIIAGGRAARAYANVLREIHAILPSDLEELCELLEEMREVRSKR